jgi:hypothetical protein
MNVAERHKFQGSEKNKAPAEHEHAVGGLAFPGFLFRIRYFSWRLEQERPCPSYQRSNVVVDMVLGPGGRCQRRLYAPFGPCTPRPNDVPADACGRIAGNIRRCRLWSAPGTAGGAHDATER